LVYVDDINLVGENNTMKKNAEALSDTIMELNTGVNTERTEYIFMSH
jgi:hypothetical protein